MHPVERLSYRTVEMYVLDKSNRRQEALVAANDIIKEILDASITDQPLLEMLDQILQEMATYEKLLHLREELAKRNPADKELA